MNICCTNHKPYKVLHLTGKIDLTNSTEVRTCLLQILVKNYPVIVDFSLLQYIDTSGIATLVDGLVLANKRKLSLIISGAAGLPLQVLEITRLNQVFKMINKVCEI